MISPALAAEGETTLVAGVHGEDTHVVGRLNANTATRDELLSVPSLDAAKVDRILAARQVAKLTSLVQFQLSDDALARLVLTGPSTLRRIRPLPLEVFTETHTAATR